MYIHGAVINVNVCAPDTIQQLAAGEYASRCHHEIFKQTIFGRAQMHFLVFAIDAVLLTVENEITDF